MGRKSKLTEAEWEQVKRRLLAGEPRRVVARDFKISESTIRERLSAQVAEIKVVAQQIVATERALTAMPLSAQVSAQNLAAKLRSISDNLASAADYGAMTAHRLNALANTEVAKVDDAEPLKSLDALRGVTVLTRLANDASQIGVNLLAANKEVVKNMNDQARPTPARVAVVIEDASDPDAET